MKANAKQRQQGDVRRTKIDAIPAGAIEIKPDKRGIVVAEGETTGHYHGIKTTKKVRFFKLDDVLFKAVLLEHQEHHPITVEPGVTEFGPIHEVDHLAGLERKVID